MRKYRSTARKLILASSPLVALALLLIAHSAGGVEGWADSPEYNGHWVRTDLAIDQETEAVAQGGGCPDGFTRCKEWCSVVDGVDYPSGEVCCLQDGANTSDRNAECVPILTGP